MLKETQKKWEIKQTNYKRNKGVGGEGAGSWKHGKK